MPELAIGSVFAGHRIEELVGRGGMGVVYRGTHLALDRPVALKLIAADLAGEEGFRERFRRESRIAATLDHPHVVTVHHAGEEDGVLFITMRYVDGDDLRTIIDREGRLEPRRAAEIVRQAGEALDAAHARGLVHRDVKPGNILVAQSGGRDHVYLTDFGLSKRDTSVAITNTGQVVGTLDYIAPEQIKGEPVDARTDVYALGCVLFHAVTGQVPYPAGHYAAKVYAQLNQSPPEMSELVPGVPPRLEEVTRRAMAKEPDDRFQTAGELGAAAVAAATPGASAATTRPRSVPAERPAPTEAAVPVVEPPRRRLPAGRARLAALVLVVTVAAVAGVLLARGGSGQVTAEEAEGVLGRYQAALTNGDLSALERILSDGFTRKLLADEPTDREASLANYKAAFEARGAAPRYSLQNVRVASGDGRATATARYSFTGGSTPRLGDVGATNFGFVERDGRVLLDSVETYPDVVTPLPATVERSDYPLEVAIRASTRVPGGSRVTIANGRSRLARPPDAVNLPLTPTGRRVLHGGQSFQIRMTLRLADGTRQPVEPYETAFNPGPRR